jgi:hypothetical protein
VSYSQLQENLKVVLFHQGVVDMHVGYDVDDDDDDGKYDCCCQDYAGDDQDDKNLGVTQ